MLKADIATRNPNNTPFNIMSTEYQLHKSQRSAFKTLSNVIDYSEHKLLNYIKMVTDVQQKQILTELVSKYKKGNVAIAWQQGRPIWIPITKDL